MEKSNEKIMRKKEMYDIISECIDKMKEVLSDNIIETVEFHANGGNIVLNPDHFKIKMAFNINDYEDVPYTVLALKDFEKEEMKIVRKLLTYLPTDAVCLDIGANMGWYTLHIKKKYPDMKVYSFEPSPVTYDRLCNNMELNGFLAETCINAGLYKEKGKLKFYYDPNGSGASSMVNLRERECVQEILVDMLTMDKWMENNQTGGVDFIKCDVEGSELFVYQGGLETLKKYKPVVFSEMLRKWSAKFGYHPNDIIELFKNIGYSCFVITEESYLKEIKEVTEETVETNYFFLHKEKHGKIREELVLNE